MTILAPFSDDVQALLIELDEACAVQHKNLKEEAKKASLGGKYLEVDMETLVWLKFIKGYGILFNRGVDAGWIKGVITNDK